MVPGPLARKVSNKGGVQVKNRKASFDYEILERLEAGLMLQGSEVKSIRDGKVSLAESFAHFEGGELFLAGAHIAEYPQAHGRNHDPVRPRKLLLHRRELRRLGDEVQRAGLTIVPLALYTKEGIIKLEVGLCRGKKVHDKRHSIRERQETRDMQRALRREE